MRLISCHDKKLHVQPPGLAPVCRGVSLSGWDDLIPNGLARRTVHELLFDRAAGHALPSFPALLLARGMMGLVPSPDAHADDSLSSRKLIWCDPGYTLYPPAVTAAGIPLDRLCIVRPHQAA